MITFIISYREGGSEGSDRLSQRHYHEIGRSVSGVRFKAEDP